MVKRKKLSRASANIERIKVSFPRFNFRATDFTTRGKLKSAKVVIVRRRKRTRRR